MPIVRIDKWKCDLCEQCKDVIGNDKPEGWVKISIENPYLDRDWYERVICPSCVQKIDSGR